MKKWIALMLICMLLTAGTAAAGAEEEAPALAGDWYASLGGVPVQMNLGEDGSYAITLPGYKPETGAWEWKDGFVTLNGAEPPDLSVYGEKLFWSDAFTFFSREEQDTYVPAEPAADLQEEACRGYWKSVYVDMDGTVYPAQVMHDRTDLYVEGHSAILGGPVFRDVLLQMEKTDGMMSCILDEVLVQLRMQEDGMLRLTLTVEGEEMIWYMLRASAAAPDHGNGT